MTRVRSQLCFKIAQLFLPSSLLPATLLSVQYTTEYQEYAMLAANLALKFYLGSILGKRLETPVNSKTSGLRSDGTNQGFKQYVRLLVHRSSIIPFSTFSLNSYYSGSNSVSIQQFQYHFWGTNATTSKFDALVSFTQHDYKQLSINRASEKWHDGTANPNPVTSPTASMGRSGTRASGVGLGKSTPTKIVYTRLGTLVPNPSCPLFDASSTCEDVGRDGGGVKKEVRQFFFLPLACSSNPAHPKWKSVVFHKNVSWIKKKMCRGNCRISILVAEIIFIRSAGWM
ncbi:hypothetical protein B0H13DRAFT_1928522 [Mycena leptocephala]|nr:hypothetical protein B0H13DRAFT_1928522 [Mycena leptocephala]